MTSHELAASLLALPDAPVALYVNRHSYLTEAHEVSHGKLGIDYQETYAGPHVVIGNNIPPMVDNPQTVRENQVVQTKDGRKYVAAQQHFLPVGATVVCSKPHADGDYSYCCGATWCRCSQ